MGLFDLAIQVGVEESVRACTPLAAKASLQIIPRPPSIIRGRFSMALMSKHARGERVLSEEDQTYVE